jgi:hypothetical protein
MAGKRRNGDQAWPPGGKKRMVAKRGEGCRPAPSCVAIGGVRLSVSRVSLGKKPQSTSSIPGSLLR